MPMLDLQLFCVIFCSFNIHLLRILKLTQLQLNKLIQGDVAPGQPRTHHSILLGPSHWFRYLFLFLIKTLFPLDYHAETASELLVLQETLYKFSCMI